MNPKITLVSFYANTAIYQGDKLLGKLTDYRHIAAALKLLGYEVEQLDIPWESMPPEPKQGKPDGYYAPSSLADLKAHQEVAKLKRRKDRIKDLHLELARLEAEEKK
jgi:peptidoglycan hydrolase-like protein with peptidoglycan-binding domain